MPANANKQDDDSKGGGFMGILIAIIIILIWLLVFALLIKLDVGGFGNNVMRPLIQDIPGLNRILPATDEDTYITSSGEYNYKTLYEAITRIKELEEEVAVKDDQLSVDAEAIADLRNEIARLRVFEEQQLAFEELKKKFDTEVVFTENAPDIIEYKKWYEQIYPENAEELYIRVLERLAYSEKVKEWASTYEKMEADAAAAILSEMTGDLDLVTQILMNMSAARRAAILAEMDPVFAAKLTHVMYPE
ncbi:MAG: hypothetical protein K6C69_07940 [Lachnospiraceae bacterium]|nr:hypothetical protein [Lachnospiraceae bacterium]